MLRSILKQLYRWIQAKLVKPYLLPFWFSKEHIQQANERHLKPSSSGFSNRKRYWFHAASVGELECLWPLVTLAAENQHELILTILSESAWATLGRLSQSLSQEGRRILFSGYSPWEGEWSSAF